MTLILIMVLFCLHVILLPNDALAVRSVWFIQGITNATIEVNSQNLYTNKYRIDLENSIQEYKNQKDKIEKAKAKVYLVRNLRLCLVQFYLLGAKDKMYYKYLHKVYKDYISKEFQNWSQVVSLTPKYIKKAGINFSLKKKVKHEKKRKKRH